MTFYACAGIWSCVYWRWWGMIDWRALPATLAALWLFYVLWTGIANWKVRSRYMLLMPLYALLQGTLMPPLGVITYFRVARRRRSWGRYRFGYRRRTAAELAALTRA